MKIFAFLSAFFLALPVTVNAQKELLKFEHPLIDAGTMTEDDAPRTFTFVGKNVSRKVLHISQVRTTCGCTRSFVKGDVMQPGDTCQVQITFTPNRYPGTINTGAFLYLKEVEGQPVVKLALTGRVLPGADVWARYPHKMGTLRLKQAKASITEVKPGTQPSARILCGNSGDKRLLRFLIVAAASSKAAGKQGYHQEGEEFLQIFHCLYLFLFIIEWITYDEIQAS